MTEPEDSPPKVCICGHYEQHHAYGVSGALYRPCEWRGCGCPRLVVSVANGDEQPATTT